VYVVSGHVRGATSVTNGSRDPLGRLVDCRPRGMKVLYKTGSSPIR
jgi:hypothetical protein